MIENMKKALVMMQKAMELLENTHFAADSDCGGISRCTYDDLDEIISALSDDIMTLDDKIALAESETREV